MGVDLVTFLELVSFSFLGDCNLELAGVNLVLLLLWLFLLGFLFLLRRFNIDHFDAE